VNLFNDREIKYRTKAHEDQQPGSCTGHEPFPFLFVEGKDLNHRLEVVNHDRQVQTYECKEQDNAPSDDRSDEFQWRIHNPAQAGDPENGGSERVDIVSVTKEGIHSQFADEQVITVCIWLKGLFDDQVEKKDGEYQQDAANENRTIPEVAYSCPNSAPYFSNVFCKFCFFSHLSTPTVCCVNS
jgi:hypothetical protein